MSGEKADNSWYKYLESLQKTSTSTPTSTMYQRNTILERIIENNLYQQHQYYLLSYECHICKKPVLELRVENACNHDYCEACVPRVNCIGDCSSWFLDALSDDDLDTQLQIIEVFESVLGVKTLKAAPAMKRKKPEDEDDEMQE